MQELYKVQDEFKKAAKIDFSKYQQMYAESVSSPDIFWAKEAERLSWHKKWNTVKNTSFIDDVSIKWFEGGKLNVTENCIDRHLSTRGNQTAIIWEGDNPAESKNITYNELYAEVCKLTNALISLGVKKSDRVTIYMPMVPEAAYAMLACARIGAAHSVVFAGFSPDALASRIDGCESDFIITADEGLRGGKKVPLKNNVDIALTKINHKIKNVIVLKRTGGEVKWNEKDIWYHELVANQPATHKPEYFDSEHPLFILYTSGSTGKPKGVLHTSAGYLLFAAMTHEYVFDYKDGEVYWCTADVGWVTGHSYIVYGPLANGATSLMFEGIPTYPDASRFWQVIDKHKVNIFYTAPTAIRALMAQGDEFVTKTSRKTLRVLGSVGEPINPEAWRWYYDVVGNKNCPIVDTWWQTETGGHLITPIAGATDLKAGSASFPFFGVQPVILDSQTGKELEGEAEGVLCIKDSWPGQMRSVYGDHKRFIETYFSQYKGYYFTGDGAKRDKDGYYWITGRVDDVLNISGHRIGTAEVESALVGHEGVSEAAVVGISHNIKGQAIYAYVTLKSGLKGSNELGRELIKHVRQEIGAIATPDIIHFTPALPKTRSGKIMRRILRKIANRDTDNLGDTSTLLNPEIVAELIEANRHLMAS